MARLPRVVVPGVAHHVTQRGNRRQQLFLEEGDYALYLDLMGEACRSNGVDVWSYCLMPNHVHLIMVPADRHGLSRAVGEAHRRYSACINARLRVTGHLFQGRFGCVATDEARLLTAIRYVAMNPVKAKLAQDVTGWRWSSARALAAGQDDLLVTCAPVLERTGDFLRFLDADEDQSLLASLERGASIGRPLMDEACLEALERETGLPLKPRRRELRPRERANEGQQDLL